MEKDGEAVRKLYITSIRSQDAGSYICSAVVDGQRLEKNVTMMLFSMYSVISVFIIVFFAAQCYAERAVLLRQVARLSVTLRYRGHMVTLIGMLRK